MSLQISMVPFSTAPSFTVAQLQQQLAQLWPDLPPSSDPCEEENTCSLQIGDCFIAIGLMPAPIPWGDLEGPCATSILWPDAEAALKPHQMHAVVTVSGEVDPVALSTLLTQATVALMATTPTALGVFWCNAALLVPKGIFTDMALEIMPMGPPLYIWVDFRVGWNEERTASGFTTGMRALGHMEFETHNASDSPAELRERLMSLAGYVLDNGPVIKDGNTVGESAEERIQVVYAESGFGIEGEVMLLEYQPLPSSSLH